MIIITTILGLASRRFPQYLPSFVSQYAGDTLWALMVFLLIGTIFTQLPTWKVAGLAWLFSFLIELSQLYHAPWIDSLRQNKLVALIIGQGFLWSDLICYTLGIGIGILIENCCLHNRIEAKRRADV